MKVIVISAHDVDYSQIINEQCGQTDETTVETCDFVVENSQDVSIAFCRTMYIHQSTL